MSDQNATIAAAAVATAQNLSEAQVMLVRIIAAGTAPREVEVATNATLADALAAAGMSMTDKLAYTQGGTALRADSPVAPSSSRGAIVAAAAGANG